MKIGSVLAVIEHDLQLIEKLRRFISESTCCTIKIARSSQEAILHLRGVGVYADRNQYPIPDLIMLDPQGRTGADLEVLAWLRTDNQFASVGIAILSAPDNSAMRLPYLLDASSVIVNRHTFDGLADTIHRCVTRNIFNNDDRVERGKLPPQAQAGQNTNGIIPRAD